MIHRRTQFRGHLDSVQKVMDMAANNEINLLVNSEVTHLEGSDTQRGLQRVGISTDEKDEITWVDCDYFLPLFGLSPKLGPIADWGLNINKSAIEVNTFDYSTNIPGIYAIGDVNTYPGKLKLILCGFHEATLMVQSAFKRIHPDKNNVLKYTTVNGVQGF
jgi:thioredoxin reductase (NADPH)